MENDIAQELLGAIVIGFVLVIPVWVIYRKSGLSPWLSLILFIPVIGIFATYMILAFSNWPSVEKSG